MAGGREQDRCRRAREWASLRLDGELSELERLLLRRHLSRCGDCRGFAASIEGATRVVRATPLEAVDRPVAAAAMPRRSRRRMRFAAATALVVVSAGVGVVVGAVIGSTSHQQPPAKPGTPSVAFNDRAQTTPSTEPTTGNI